MKFKLLIPIMIFLILFSSVAIATPPVPMWWGSGAECCMSIHQGEPLKFNIIRTFKNETRIMDGFGVKGNSAQNATEINITEYTECCDYISDPLACKQCVIDTKAEQEKEQRTEYFLLSILPFILLIILIGIILTFTFLKSLKEFLRFNWKKLIFSIIILLIGLYSVVMSVGPSRSKILPIIFLILFWPFLVILKFEKLIINNVDWIHAIDIPFIIIALLLTALWIWALSCLIVLLIRKLKS